jgi:hypothetical protein
LRQMSRAVLIYATIVAEPHEISLC